jgi:hypothetical protein
MMRAGKQYEYRWQDPDCPHYQTPRSVSGPLYMELLVGLMGQMAEEFRVTGRTGPFDTVIRRIIRLFIHLYLNHGLSDFDLTLYQFLLFLDRFGLAPSRSEFDPAPALLENLRLYSP